MRERLVDRARGGDESAFTELVDLEGDRCYAIAYRILRDVERAQDAVQQALILAWRELPRLRDPERFEPALPPPGQRLLRGGTWYRRWSLVSHPAVRRADSLGHDCLISARTPWNARSCGSRRSTGRSSSCTITSACRWPRSPRSLGSRSARSSPDSITPRGTSARRSPQMTPRRRRRSAWKHSRPDAIIAAWLEDGPLAADGSRRVVASSIHLTPQRRGPLAWLPWKESNHERKSDSRGGRRHPRAAHLAGGGTASNRRWRRRGGARRHGLPSANADPSRSRR